MSCGVNCRHGLDSVLLWLWCRQPPEAPIQHLAWDYQQYFKEGLLLCYISWKLSGHNYFLDQNCLFACFFVCFLAAFFTFFHPFLLSPSLPPCLPSFLPPSFSPSSLHPFLPIFDWVPCLGLSLSYDPGYMAGINLLPLCDTFVSLIWTLRIYWSCLLYSDPLFLTKTW